MAYSSAGGAAMFAEEGIIRKTAKEQRNEKVNMDGLVKTNSFSYDSLIVKVDAQQKVYKPKARKVS